MGADLGALALIDRRLAQTLLRDLLQAPLVVLVLRGLRQRAVPVQVVVVRRVVTGVEEDRAEERLERVGEQRFQAASAPARDALAEVQVAAEVELLRELRKRVGVDHRRPRLGQLAFARSGVVLVQILGGDELQDGIAQVLESLVVARRQVRALIGE